MVNLISRSRIDCGFHSIIITVLAQSIQSLTPGFDQTRVPYTEYTRYGSNTIRMCIQTDAGKLWRRRGSLSREVFPLPCHEFHELRQSFPSESATSQVKFCFKEKILPDFRTFVAFTKLSLRVSITFFNEQSMKTLYKEI